MTILYHHPSPVGLLQLECTDSHLVAVRIVTNEESKNLESTANKITSLTIKQLDEYFKGERTEFTLPIQQSGTPFQEMVWNELLRIPYGETISYKQLAARIGHPKSSRAVGNANGKNNLCIIVPCHRVIESNGSLGGYAYGIETKRKLLNLERKAFNII